MGPSPPVPCVDSSVSHSGSDEAPLLCGLFTNEGVEPKIDRIDNEEVEKFKAQMLASQHEGRTVAEWTRIIRDLNGDDAKAVHAASVLKTVYDSL